MTTGTRRKIDAALKAKIALEAWQEQATVADLAQRYQAALGPKPRLSKPSPGHKIYPYLLRGLAIERPNQVWCADITISRFRAASSIRWRS